MPFVPFTRWDPLHDLLALHERMNRLGGESAPGWSPAVDVYERPDRFVISVELPGLTREDIKIEAQPDTVTLRGERPVHQSAQAHYHRVERGHGAFVRSFALPLAIDVDRIAADFHDGVLTIVAPKAAVQPHRVEVR